MKRSEMIERLVFYILESSGHDDATDFAEGILNWLEQQGMLPPAIKVLTTGQEDGEVFELNLLVNEWEPEDEKK